MKISDLFIIPGSDPIDVVKCIGNGGLVGGCGTATVFCISLGCKMISNGEKRKGLILLAGAVCTAACTVFGFFLMKEHAEEMAKRQIIKQT